MRIQLTGASWLIDELMRWKKKRRPKLHTQLRGASLSIDGLMLREKKREQRCLHHIEAHNDQLRTSIYIFLMYAYLRSIWNDISGVNRRQRQTVVYSTHLRVEQHVGRRRLHLSWLQPIDPLVIEHVPLSADSVLRTSSARNKEKHTHTRARTENVRKKEEKDVNDEQRATHTNNTEGTETQNTSI